MIKIILPIGIVIVLICFITTKPSASLPISECDKTKAVIVDCTRHHRWPDRAGDYVPTDEENTQKLKEVTHWNVQYCDSTAPSVVKAKQDCKLITRGVD